MNNEHHLQLKQLLTEAKGSFYTRIKGILFSSEQYSIDEISEILSVHRNTVSNWIDSFEKEGIEGLKIKPGRGRNYILTESEQKKRLKLPKSIQPV